MPLDTSIALQARPFRVDDPLDKYAKYMGIAQAQRQFTMEDAVSDAARSSGGDPEKMSRVLMEQGQFAPAMQLQTQARAQKKTEIEENLKLAEAAGSDSIAVDQLYRQALQETGGDQAAAIAKVQPVYSQVRQKWQAMGHGKEAPETFDPNANFASIGRAKEVIQYLKTLAPNVHMTDTGGTVTPTNTNPLAGPVGPVPGTQPIPKTGAPTELSRLMSERDALPEGDPRRVQYDKTIQTYKAGRGTDVTVNTGNMALGQHAAGKIDDAMLGATRGLMQVDQITKQFKPEYQRFQDKAGFAALSLKDSTVGLTNKEKQDLTEFSQYRRNAISQINEYIHDVTGSAMGVDEAKRLMKAVPNPGAGLFDGDSPTEFKAKLDDVMSKLKMSVARLSYIKRNGMSLEDGKGNPVIALERMPAVINERGKALETEIKTAQPDLDAKGLQREVRRRLGTEFGLASD